MNNKNKNRNTAIIVAGGVLLVGATLVLQNYLADQGIELPQEEAEAAPEDVDEIPLAPLVEADWRLIATYTYYEPEVGTNIDYVFDAQFNLVDDKIKTVGKPQGDAFGLAGIVVNDDCIETEPLEIVFTFVLAGKVVKIAQTELIGENDFSRASVTGGQVQVLEVEPKDAVIESSTLPPFEECASTVNEKFLAEAATIWITGAPFLEVQYRRFPLAAGVHCPGTIASAGASELSTLSVCYQLIDLKNQ